MRWGSVGISNTGGGGDRWKESCIPVCHTIFILNTGLTIRPKLHGCIRDGISERCRTPYTLPNSVSQEPITIKIVASIIILLSWLDFPMYSTLLSRKHNKAGINPCYEGARAKLTSHSQLSVSKGEGGRGICMCLWFIKRRVLDK